MVNIVSARGPVSASGASGVPGVLVVLACSPPLCPHVEFGVSAVLSTPVSLTWVAQPSRPGQLYAALEWRSSAGTAGRLAGRSSSALNADSPTITSPLALMEARCRPSSGVNE